MGREWSFPMGYRYADGQHLVRRWRSAAGNSIAGDAAEYDAEAFIEDSVPPFSITTIQGSTYCDSNDGFKTYAGVTSTAFALSSGSHIASFGSALLAGILLAILNSGLNNLFAQK